MNKGGPGNNLPPAGKRSLYGNMGQDGQGGVVAPSAAPADIV